jgi:long-chain acyl-CoA synthetase
MNVFHSIKEAAGSYPDKTAVIEGGREVSYGRLISSAEALASWLKTEGLGPFDRVALLADNCTDYITVSLAVLSLSAVLVPVSPEHTEAETGEVIERMDAGFLIYKGGLHGVEDGYARHLSGGVKIPSGGFFNDEFHLLRKRPAGGLPDEYFKINPAFIRFSSGTTGKSKGVVLSHESIIERTDEADRGLSVRRGDNVLWVLSMSYHFVVSILLFLRRGATVVLCGDPFPESLVEGAERHNGTLIYASPFHYDLMCTTGLLPPRALRNIRLAVSTTVKLPGAVAGKFHGKFGFHLTEAYGIIEVGLPFINLSGEAEKRASVGRALPGYEVRIPEPGEDGVGEILIRGKGMLEAYFSPWQGRVEALDDGWFRTGDLGRLDEEGFLTIVGRKKSVINFMGLKIFPPEVEAVINEFPGVRESLVFGEEHPRFGQLPAAKVVSKDGTLDLNGLGSFCYRRLAQYKVPKDFALVSDLPRTKSGKIRR